MVKTSQTRLFTHNTLAELFIINVTGSGFQENGQSSQTR